MENNFFVVSEMPEIRKHQILPSTVFKTVPGRLIDLRENDIDVQ